MRISLPCSQDYCDDCYLFGCLHDCHFDPEQIEFNLRKSLYWADALEAIGVDPKAA